MGDAVEEPVDFGKNGSFVGLVESRLEIGQSHAVRLVDGQRVHEILDIVRLQLGNARIQHHVEQRDKQGRVLSQSHVSSSAERPEAGKFRCVDVIGLAFAVASGYHHDKVFRQHERRSFSPDADFAFEMAQKMAEIDVK